jgi:hypothetical protein
MSCLGTPKVLTCSDVPDQYGQARPPGSYRRLHVEDPPDHCLLTRSSNAAQHNASGYSAFDDASAGQAPLFPAHFGNSFNAIQAREKI